MRAILDGLLQPAVADPRSAMGPPSSPRGSAISPSHGSRLNLAAAASAEKGGEIPFKTDPQKAMKMAKAQGFGMMLYFTSDG